MPYKFYRSLFVIFLFCELLLFTSQRMRYFGARENAIVLISIAAGMGLLAMLAAFKKMDPAEKQQEAAWENRLMKIVAFIGVPLCIFHFYREVSLIPIDVKISDIVPTIQVLNQRLLQGQYPYNLITEFGYNLSPTYLPFMWLPFLPAAIFHFDERWVAFAVWAIAAFFLIRRAHISKFSNPAKWLITVLPAFYFILIEEATSKTYGNTIELMIAGFYMLFALQLDNIRGYIAGSPWKKGAMFAFFIVLCLLSRYAFLLWLPLCFGIVWVENRKLALRTSVWVFAYVMLIYVLPFLSKDPMIYINGIKHYSEGALYVWLEPRDFGALYEGLGIACFFRDGWGGEMADRLAALQRWQVIISLGSAAFAGFLYWKKRAQMQHLSLFLLGSLKFYFAFFYGFIQMPYTYLMLTPVFFSLVVLLAFYRGADKPTLTAA